MNRGLAQALIVTLCLGAVLLIALIVSGGEFDDTVARVIGSVALIVVYSLTGLASLSLRDKKAEWFGVTGVFISGLALVVGVLAIWLVPEDDDGLEWLLRTAGILAVLAFWSGHSSFLLRSQRETDPPAAVAVRQGTILLGFIFAVMLSVVIGGEEIDGRVFAVGAVIYLLGSAVGPLLRRL